MESEELAKGINHIFSTEREEISDDEAAIYMARMIDSGHYSLEAADPLLQRYLSTNEEGMAEFQMLVAMAQLGEEADSPINVLARPDKKTLLEKIKVKIDEMIQFTLFPAAAPSAVRGATFNFDPVEIETDDGLLIELDPALNEQDSSKRDLFVRVELDQEIDFEGVQVEAINQMEEINSTVAATIDKYNEAVLRGLEAETEYTLQLMANGRHIQIQKVSIP
ncbi:MAG: hypothetical protein AAGD96_26790 [Chloroflexota bacterium]